VTPKIVLSKITTRNDAHSDAVKTVNPRLKQFSRQNGWKLISHANITQNGLNKGGSHLNREGNDSSHRNFVNFLRNNNWSPGSLNAASPISVKPPYVSWSNASYDFSNIRRTAASKPPCLPYSLPANRGFKIASLNVNSLIKHIDDLRIFLADNPVNVLAINESKLDDCIKNCELYTPGYEIIHRDRNRNGVGVCFYIKTSINFVIRRDLNLNDLENLCLEIQKPCSKPFLTVTWYKPPFLTLWDPCRKIRLSRSWILSYGSLELQHGLCPFRH